MREVFKPVICPSDFCHYSEVYVCLFFFFFSKYSLFLLSESTFYRVESISAFLTLDFKPPLLKILSPFPSSCFSFVADMLYPASLKSTFNSYVSLSYVCFSLFASSSSWASLSLNCSSTALHWLPFLLFTYFSCLFIFQKCWWLMCVNCRAFLCLPFVHSALPAST